MPLLEQVIYKWNNTRRTLSRIFPDTYRLLSEDGRGVTRNDIQRDITRLFRSNAEAWMVALARFRCADRSLALVAICGA
jgi:hypothetical protein